MGGVFRASNVWEHKVNRLIISRVTAQVKISVTMAGHSGRRPPHARLSGQTERSSEVFQPGQARQERRRAGSFVHGQMASCLLQEKKKKKRSSGEEWRQKVVRTQSGPFLPLLFFPPSGSLALLFLRGLCGGTAERVSVLSLLRGLAAERRSGRRHPHVQAERALRRRRRREE